MSRHRFSVECTPMTFVVVHGTPAQLDLAIETVLRFGSVTTHGTPIPCPDRPGCQMALLTVGRELTTDEFHDALHEFLVDHTPPRTDLTHHEGEGLMNRTDTGASAAPRNCGDVRAAHAPDPTPADLLRGAAGYLDAHGWHQGALYDRRGESATPPACAMGALYLAAYGDLATAEDVGYELDLTPAVRDALRLLSAHLVDTTGRYPDHDSGEYQTVIGDWNDEHRRTITDVTTALRAAADTWDRTHRAADNPGAQQASTSLT